MYPFTYSRLSKVDEISDVFSPESAQDPSKTKFIAGGTNLLDLMKQNVSRPSELIDINDLPLSKITELPEGGLRLGALVTNADTAYHPLVQEQYPLLSQTILAGASPQLRNMATNGGNLFQRTRCNYFYDTSMPCNKREPSSGCGAINGFNRVCGILGTSDEDVATACIATNPSDMSVALAALEATVCVLGPSGERSIPMADFHRLPGNSPQYDNTVQTGELVTAIDLPPLGFADHFTYLKLRDRTSYAFALVSVAVGITLKNNKVEEARIALGGVAHKPWRKREAELLLIGHSPNQSIFESVAESLLIEAKGYGYNNFKIEMAKNAIVHALNLATDLKKGN